MKLTLHPCLSRDKTIGFVSDQYQDLELLQAMKRKVSGDRRQSDRDQPAPASVDHLPIRPEFED